MSVKFQDEQVGGTLVQESSRFSHSASRVKVEDDYEDDDDRKSRDEDDAKGRHEKPPKNIFEASERGCVGWIVKAVERTLEFNINQRDRLQRTALHWAAECGQVEAVEALMDYGCDRRATECNGRTPIHLAARGLHVPVIKALLEDTTPHEMELLVNQTDNFGITPVFMTLQKGDEGRLCFQFLMDCGARYNTTSMPKLLPEDIEKMNKAAAEASEREKGSDK